MGFRVVLFGSGAALACIVVVWLVAEFSVSGCCAKVHRAAGDVNDDEDEGGPVTAGSGDESKEPLLG